MAVGLTGSPAAGLADTLAASGPRVSPLMLASLGTEAPVRPAFNRMETDSAGLPVLAGIASPGATVSLTLNGFPVTQTLASADGTWRMVLRQGLQAGEVRIGLVSTTVFGDAPLAGETLKISMPAGVLAKKATLYVAESVKQTRAGRGHAWPKCVFTAAAGSGADRRHVGAGAAWHRRGKPSYRR